jgi:hypothetical protein
MNPAPKGDPTGKYTLNGWGQTEADFAFFDLAQDKVEFKSDGWRTEKIADDPNVYEWWYFDIHNHDEMIVTGMLSPQTAIGACLVSASPWCAEQSPSPVNSCIPAEIRTRSSDAICGGRVASMSLLLSTTTETVRASVGINALLFAVCGHVEASMF